MKNWDRVADVAYYIKKHACYMDLAKCGWRGIKECQRDFDVAEYLMTRLSV